MIDFHSHVLPKMDDGSSNVEESIQMLEMLWAQGVKKVVATPHFVANSESIDKFLQRRQKSYEMLCEKANDNLPKMVLGAEVEYYSGIGRMENLDKLCIEGTSILLLEMPFVRWTEYTVRELEEISATKNVTVVLAHVERYIAKNGINVLHRLYQNGIFMQVNAECFETFLVRRKICRLFENGAIRFLGSDCHNTTSRKPQIYKAFDFLKKKYGEEFINQFNEYGSSILF